QIAADPFAGRELALHDPLALRWIFEQAGELALPVALEKGTPYVTLADGSWTLLRIVGKNDPFDVEFSKSIIADLRARLAGREARLLGGYAIAVEDERRIRGDLVGNGTVSFVLVTLFLLWSTRSWLEPLLLAVPNLLALFCALPIGAWLFGPLSPLAIGAAGILAGLGADCTIHWLGRYDEERRRPPRAEAPT